MTHAAAPAPSRSTFTVRISMGLVNIEVGAYTASEDVRVARREFTIDGHEVGRQAYDKQTGEAVAADAVVRKATATDGTLVTLRDEEIEACTSDPRGVAAIETLIPLAAIGTIYRPDGTVYQLRPKAMPKKGGVDPTAARALALLLAGLADRGEAALVRVALRGPARYAAVTPDGLLIMLRPAQGVRAALPLPEVTLSDQEVAMARMLLDSIGTSTPVLNDETVARVQAFVDAKAAGTPAPAVEAAPVVEADDLMARLLASVEAARANKAVAA